MANTENWDPVPWAVGGTARHSTNVARNVAFGAFAGLEGIVSPQACEVRERDVPGASVQVFPGTVAILNRAADVFDEMYVGRLPSVDTVDVAATDGSGGRSDLIIARVENPHITTEPWAAPSDPKVGPYIFTRVISDVPATTRTAAELGLGYSAIALARIDLPASTTAVTQDMITDLRTLSQRQQSRLFNVVAPTGTQDLTSGSFVNWPSEANLYADVPSWATHARVKGTLSGILFGDSGNNGGSGWMVYGDLRVKLSSGDTARYSQVTAYKVASEGGRQRTTLMCGAPTIPIPPAVRGTQTTIRIEGDKLGGSTTLTANEGSMVSLDVEFINDAESNV